MSGNFKDLAAPFPPEEISWRLGFVSRDKMKGMALAYLDARSVMDRLDTIIGPAYWQCRYSHAGSKTVCDIGIQYEGEWIWKADGAGDSDVEAEKGALSDAFKRAAVRWGIGRYLYEIESPWVEIEEAGKSFKIRAAEYKRLDMILRRHAASYGKPVTPDGLTQAKKDIAAMQASGEQKLIETATPSRIAALAFTKDVLALFAGFNSATLTDWYKEQYSKTKTNAEKLSELQEKHPDLHERITIAADEIRMRGQ